MPCFNNDRPSINDTNNLEIFLCYACKKLSINEIKESPLVMEDKDLFYWYLHHLRSDIVNSLGKLYGKNEDDLILAKNELARMGFYADFLKDGRGYHSENDIKIISNDGIEFIFEE